MPSCLAPPARRTHLVHLLLAGILLAALGIGGEARAQGTSGMLPDPIASADLTEYAQRLGMSDQQRLAADRFHEAYLEEFRRLREQEIDEFLAESGNLVRSFMFAPDASKAKSALGDLNRLMARIRSLDERLFDQIQTVLSETQVETMPRVRRARERTRYRSGVVRFIGFANAGARADVAETLEAVSPDAEERDRVDPLLLQYESRLTAELRRLYDEAQAMIMDIVKRLEEMLAAQENVTDPRAARRMFQRMGDMWREASKGVITQASEVSSLNRRTLRGFADVLTPETGRRLVDAYREDAYPEVARGDGLALSKYDAALRLPGLGDEQRGMVEDARVVLRGQLDVLAEQMIDCLEEMRKDAGALRFPGAPASPMQEKLDGISGRRDELNRQAIVSLEAMLGAVLAARLDEAAETERPAPSEGALGFGARAGDGRGAPPPAGGDRDDAARDAAPATGDPFLPGPIDAKLVSALADRAALESDRRSILDSLHVDYLETFETLRTESIAPVLEAGRSLWAIDPESGRIRPPAPEAIDTLFSRRRAALDAILALDASFFEDVALAVLDDDDASRAVIRRMRLARDRQVYARDGGGGAGGVPRSFPGARGMRGFIGEGTREAAIDLVDLADAQRLPGEDRKALDRALDPYEAQLVELLRQRFEQVLRSERQSLDASAARAASGERGPGGPAAALMLGGWREIGETESAIVALNRATLDAVVGALPAETGASLRRAYRRAANPDVYDDPRSAEPAFVNALGLADLTAGQRTDINDLYADYRGSYATLCEQMADLATASADASAGDLANMDWQKVQERRNEMERLRFDRDELTDKARRRLRAVLTPAQLEVLGMAEEGEGR